MNTTNYNVELWATWDETKGEIVHIGRANNGGQYAREVIPGLKGLVPLKDIKMSKLGKINPFTGEISELEETKKIDWKELYNFVITNESVKNESETSENTNKE